MIYLPNYLPNYVLQKGSYKPIALPHEYTENNSKIIPVILRISLNKAKPTASKKVECKVKTDPATKAIIPTINSKIPANMLFSMI